MEVINVKVKNLRENYYCDNLKEWIEKSDNNIYIGRKQIVFINKERYPKTDSKYANPFKIKDLTREEVCKKYKKYILEKYTKEEIKRDLTGKILGCWCKPEMCHGDILLEIINE